MQIHNSYEDRIEVVRETTLATFKKRPNDITDYRNDLQEKYARMPMISRKRLSQGSNALWHA